MPLFDTPKPSVERTLNVRRPMPAVLATALSIVLSGSPASAGFLENKSVVTDADNELLFGLIAAGIATHNVALPLAFSPDPIVGGTAEAAVYVSNIGLKYLPPTLQEPDDLVKLPNSGGDNCTWDFTMPQSSWKRVDYLSLIPLSPTPDDWGDLGAPQVYHANTDVVIRAVNSHIPLADSPPRVGIFARNESSDVAVSFPAGNHVVRWEAEAQLDPIMDLYIPPLLSLFAADFRYASIGTNASANSAKSLTKTQFIKEIGTALLVEAGVLVGGEYLDEQDLPEAFQGQQTAAHHRLQLVTVNDITPPQFDLAQTAFRFEATGLGGTERERFWEQNVASTFTAFDPCGRPISFSDNGPEQFYPLGTTQVEVTVSDRGPNRNGLPNRVSRQLQVTIEDTQAPIIVAPPSRVVEVPAGTAGLDPVALMLGRPQVVDLADASPTINNDGPAFYPIDSRADIIWSATDGSGNTSTARQFVTVKTEGTNTTPTVEAITASTLTSQPVNIVLRGTDGDFLDDQFDPLSFKIETPPARGEFVAPLLPFFIDDYRTSPAGPYGEAFLAGEGFSGNRFNWMSENVCKAAVNPIPGLPPGTMDNTFVYEPSFVKVLDDGTYFLLDKGWGCSQDRSRTGSRISKWSKDDEYIGATGNTGDLSHFVLDEDGFIYVMSFNGSGSSRSLLIQQCGSAFEVSNGDYCARSWKFDFSSAPGIFTEQLAYARVDAKRGVLFLADTRRIFAFDVRDTPANQPGEANRTHRPPHVGTLFNGERLLGAVRNTGCGSGARSEYTLDLDSAGNLYAADFCDRRVHKFAPSSFTSTGEFQLGEFIGWLGYCESSTNKACDVDKQRSRGFSCSNETCPLSSDSTATAGSGPGQFASISHLVVSPDDILYVADSGNSRIQRFGPDGTFGGEAVSTGTGINQGDQPGFVLGNFGRARTVSVNRSNFFVVDSDEDLVHVFQTSPLKDITSNSATVTYASQFDAHSITDTFTYTATDGLATSVPATAIVSVSRSFRPPEAFPQPDVTVTEDGNVGVTLTGDDPDGILGEDFLGLDSLSYRIVREPRFGSLAGTGADQTYTPDADFSGADYFLFVASDGLADSPPARVDITVRPVDDAPRVTDLGIPETWGRGFPLLLAGTFFDDGSVSYDTRVQWGDGTITPRGDLVEDESGTRLTGVKLVEPFNGIGRGQAIAEHTYTNNDTHVVWLCVSGEMESGGSGENCLLQNLSITPLVMLNPSVFVPVEVVPQGQLSTVAVTLTNTQPTSYAGLPATNVRLQQSQSSELQAVSLTGAPNGCSIVGGLVDCTIAVMTPGASIAFTVDVRYTGSVFFDAQANFTVSTSNLTPAVTPTAISTSIVSFSADTTDSDSDGLSDSWETAFGLNPAINDASLDPDDDGLTNAQEFANRTDPQRADTDSDGFPDGLEVADGTSPTIAADTDRDGIANDVDLDDDNDGMSDAFERSFGLDALTALDALQDRDGDGVTNLAEAQAGTNPEDASDTPAASTATPSLFSSVLPLNRATTVDRTVSAFATILNTGEAATGCAMAPLTPMAAEFGYQLTDPATNAPVGQINTPGSIAAGAAQSFVFQFTPRGEMNNSVAFRFACDGVPGANTVTGVNTFVLQASQNQTADLVALVATASNDGVVTLNGGIGAFSLASVNVGAAGFLTVRARVPDGLPVAVGLCETNPLTAACINPGVPAKSALTFFDSSSTPTFSVFPSSAGPVAFDPAVNRVFIEFIDNNGIVRGATSVAIRTE